MRKALTADLTFSFFRIKIHVLGKSIEQWSLRSSDCFFVSWFRTEKELRACKVIPLVVNSEDGVGLPKGDINISVSGLKMLSVDLS
jgi:hypothetical protein